MVRENKTISIGFHFCAGVRNSLVMVDGALRQLKRLLLRY